MRIKKLLIGIVVGAAVGNLTWAHAATRGSSGQGAWELRVQTNSEGELTDGVPEPVTDPLTLVNIPRFQNALGFTGGALTTQADDNVSVSVEGSISHFTPNNGSDAHYGLFPILPKGTFTDFGELATQNEAIIFGVEFELDFFMDGNGINQVPLLLNIPIQGVLPKGYRYNYEFEATWTDTSTDGDPAAAAVTLSDSKTITHAGVDDFMPFNDALTDNDTFGPVTANFNDFFEVDGFWQVTVDKLGADDFDDLAAVPPGGAGFEFDFDNAEGFAQVPEPGAAALALGALGLIGLRRRC